MKGRGANSVWDTASKWPDVISTLKAERIGVMALQETHMTDKLLQEIKSRYEGDARIFSSADQLNPNSKGVAILLNERLTCTEDVKVHELVPGRALQISYQWHKNKTITVLALYAPSDTPKEKEDFWKVLNDIYTAPADSGRSVPFPDIVLGDMNLTAEGIDRLPAHLDDLHAVSAMRTFLLNLKLVDGWRRFFPARREFSFTSTDGTRRARLDRIYVGEEAFATCQNWKIELPQRINTDHWQVSVELTDPALPHTGRGRYAMPRYVLTIDRVMNEIVEQGKALQKTIDEFDGGKRTRTATDNIQTHFSKWKGEVIKSIRQYVKVNVPHLDAEIAKTQDELVSVLN
ncbi:Endonuclease/exonuclease/phosphatase, partial [Schizophyllum commune]